MSTVSKKSSIASRKLPTVCRKVAAPDLNFSMTNGVKNAEKDLKDDPKRHRNLQSPILPLKTISRTFLHTIFKDRQVTDLDVTDLVFFGPRIPFCAPGALRGSVTPFSRSLVKHLSSVLGQTELCHEVQNPGPQKPQIIRKESHTTIWAMIWHCSNISPRRSAGVSTTECFTAAGL